MSVREAVDLHDRVESVVGILDARKRFDAIQAVLEQTHQGASISVGFAQLKAGDTLDDLIAHGDAALYEVKEHN
ncbi:MAG: hypothetical protein ACR2H2_04695 [Solirubrobacteraceae bacterium]